MQPNRDEVLRIIEENKNTLRRFGVTRLGLFGSVARGEQTGGSDLDFVVEFETKSFDAYMDLKAFLEQLFGVEVDLVLSDVIKPRIRKAILSEAVYASGL
jgi:predicted nucleotidyltransferase